MNIFKVLVVSGFLAFGAASAATDGTAPTFSIPVPTIAPDGKLSTEATAQWQPAQIAMVRVEYFDWHLYGLVPDDVPVLGGNYLPLDRRARGLEQPLFQDRTDPKSPLKFFICMTDAGLRLCKEENPGGMLVALTDPTLMPEDHGGYFGNGISFDAHYSPADACRIKRGEGSWRRGLPSNS